MNDVLGSDQIAHRLPLPSFVDEHERIKAVIFFISEAVWSCHCFAELVLLDTRKNLRELSSLPPNDADVWLAGYPGPSSPRSPVCGCSLVSSSLLVRATMSQETSLRQSGRFVRRALTAYSLIVEVSSPTRSKPLPHSPPIYILREGRRVGRESIEEWDGCARRATLRGQHAQGGVRGELHYVASMHSVHARYDRTFFLSRFSGRTVTSTELAGPVP